MIPSTPYLDLVASGRDAYIPRTYVVIYGPSCVGVAYNDQLVARGNSLDGPTGSGMRPELILMAKLARRSGHEC
jgi:hypothetical protein